MSAEPSLSQMRASLEQSQAALVKILDGADDAAVQRLHGEEKWSIAVMLAHLTEARSYFSHHVENWLKDPSTVIGRMLDNEQRVEAITNAQHAQPSRAQLRQWLLESYGDVTAAFSHVSDAQLDKPCIHARLGSMTFGEFLRRTFVDHDQAHVEQAQGFLQS